MAARASRSPVQGLGGVLAAGLMSFGFCFSAPVSAGADLILSPILSMTVEHDDNVFRYQDREQALAERGSRRMEDSVRQVRAGLEASVGVGLQSAYVRGTAGDVRYQEFEELDHSPHEFEGGLDWQLASFAKGSLKLEDERLLSDFAVQDGISQKDLRERRIASIDGAVKLYSDYELRTGFYETRVRHSLDVFRQQNRDEESFNFSGVYQGRAGHTIGGELILLSGEFSDRVPGEGVIEDFEQVTTQFVGNWAPSEITRIDYSLGYSKRNNNGFDVRDDSGIVGSVAMARTVSVKTRIYAGLRRRIASADAQGESTRVANQLYFGGHWDVTPKVRVILDCVDELEDYRSSEFEAGGKRDSFLQKYGLSAEYSILPWLVLTPGMIWEKRADDVERSEFEEFRAMLNFEARYALIN